MIARIRWRRATDLSRLVVKRKHCVATLFNHTIQILLLTHFLDIGPIQSTAANPETLARVISYESKFSKVFLSLENLDGDHHALRILSYPSPDFIAIGQKMTAEPIDERALLGLNLKIIHVGHISGQQNPGNPVTKIDGPSRQYQ